MWAQLLGAAASYATDAAGGSGIAGGQGGGAGGPVSSQDQIKGGDSPITTGGISINTGMDKSNPLLWVAGGLAFVLLLKAIK